MRKNTKWFEEVFLETFNNRMEVNQSVWVTENQVNVFRTYMKECKYYVGFYYKIGEYQYNLTIYKKGYGRLTKALRATAYI